MNYAFYTLAESYMWALSYNVSAIYDERAKRSDQYLKINKLQQGQNPKSKRKPKDQIENILWCCVIKHEQEMSII